MTIEIQQASIGDPATRHGSPGISADMLVGAGWVKADLGNGKWLYILQGIVIVNFESSSLTQWNYDDLKLTLYLPERPNWELVPNTHGNVWKECEINTEHFSGVMHLNSIANDSTATNAGWCIDSVGFPEWPHSNGGYVTVTAHIGARDTDGWLYRIGYNVTLYGSPEWKEYVEINLAR